MPVFSLLMVLAGMVTIVAPCTFWLFVVFMGWSLCQRCSRLFFSWYSCM